MSRAENAQNVRVAARSRLRAAPPDREPSTEVWLPSGLAAEEGSDPVRVAQPPEAVPAEPVAAAELGAEVQRLRRALADAEKRAAAEASRAERAEHEVGRLGERIEAMKRSAARAAAVAHPEGDHESADGRLDLNSASFEQLRSLGLSVTQTGRVIGQREQHGGFSSLDEVDGIVGIPRDVKQILKQHGSV